MADRARLQPPGPAAASPPLRGSAGAVAPAFVDRSPPPRLVPWDALHRRRTLCVRHLYLAAIQSAAPRPLPARSFYIFSSISVCRDCAKLLAVPALRVCSVRALPEQEKQSHHVLRHSRTAGQLFSAYGRLRRGGRSLLRC